MKLLRSGYKVSQVRQIIVSGIRGYQRKVDFAAENGYDLHRSANFSLVSRMKKKIFQKTQWFKGDKKKNKPKKNKNQKSKNNNKPVPKIKSVMFVPRTTNTELLKQLRSEESKLSEVTGYRVKLVERSGVQLRRILCRTNPFAGQHCLVLSGV